MWVAPEDAKQGTADFDSLTLYPRLTRFGATFSGPAIRALGNAKLSGLLEIDIQNGGSESRPTPRLRHGWFKLTKGDFFFLGGMVAAYCLLQYSPIILIAWFTTRFNKVHRRLLPEAKRKAILQRRGLFDFVSPFTVFLVILAYFQFVAFMFYVARHPFPGFGGPFANIGIVSLGYILLGAFAMYLIYGRKRDRLQTHADRMRMIRGVVNFYAWMCILSPIFVSLTVARQLLHLETWGPFAGTVFFLILTLLILRTVRLTAPPRQPVADGLGSSPVH